METDLARTPKHTTTTEAAGRVVSSLKKIGIVVYPGIIVPKGGRTTTPIVTVKPEENRIVIGVAKSGYQELSIYGDACVDSVLFSLSEEFPDGTIKLRKSEEKE